MVGKLFDTKALCMFPLCLLTSIKCLSFENDGVIILAKVSASSTPGSAPAIIHFGFNFLIVSTSLFISPSLTITSKIHVVLKMIYSFLTVLL